jgi:hypothetical protein
MKLNDEILCYKPGTKVVLYNDAVSNKIIGTIDRFSIFRDLSVTYAVHYWDRGDRKEVIVYQPDIVLADTSEKISIGFK